MARKSAAAPMDDDANESNYRTVRRGLLIATFVSTVLLALVWAGLQLENFLIRDPQFALAHPPDPGEESPAVTITGLKHSSHAAAAAVFEPDYGRSIYLLPIRQRRIDLLKLRWVREASVTRIWPNRVQVRITEREPVAFLHLPGSSTLALVDTEGAILWQETPEPLRLPVLVGLTNQHDSEQRLLRVRRLIKLMRDAGALSEKISEVDVSDPENLKVTQDAGGRAVTLILGNRFFKRRLEKFRQNSADLLRRDPEKTIFDLRVDGSIYARPSEEAALTEGEKPRA